jgi:hypothetical protein
MAQWPFRTAVINVSSPMAPAFAKVACARNEAGTVGAGSVAEGPIGIRQWRTVDSPVTKKRVAASSFRLVQAVTQLPDAQ